MKSPMGDKVRREPQQRRSQLTRDTMLDAVSVVLKRYGPEGVTTNRISEVAGFSIGSLYHYFPDKQAIYGALHQRHVDAVRVAVARALAEKASGPLDDFVVTLVEVLVEVHAADPSLHQLVTALVPEGPVEFRAALSEVLEHHGAPRDDDSRRMLFVLAGLIESLVHGLAEWPPERPLAAVKAEAVKTVCAYLEASRAT